MNSRWRHFGLCARALVLAIVPCSLACPGDGPSGPQGDKDGDCIGDSYEGRDERVDTDGDGTPDYRDRDSDDDGLADEVEALVASCDRESPPDDADGDGVANFRDPDSDENGIPDRVEASSDLDGDGLADVVDLDDDGDAIDDATEVRLDPAGPADSDGDGTPDYQDLDSDDDGLLDADEGSADTDADGLADSQDGDSDGDGMPDADEAGDSDPETVPRDTDRDGIADFRDVDSDNDGLLDRWEWEHTADVGTDPRDWDTDDDGVMDWIEVTARTDPTDPTDNPRTRGDFVFVVPFESASTPGDDTLAFSTAIRRADLFFALDLTESMTQELEDIRSDMSQIVDEATCGEGEDPSTTHCIPDLWVGFGWFTDASGALPAGRALEVTHNLTSDVDAVIDTMPATTLSGVAECQRKAAYCVAHGPGGECPADGPLVANLDTYPCVGARVGYPCFRLDAARLLVLITDERMVQDPIPSSDVVAGELLAAGITFVGINADSSASRAVGLDLAELALAAESIDADGRPLVFDGADENVADAVADSVSAVARSPMDVWAVPLDGAGDNFDATLLIEGLEARPEGTGECVAWAQVGDSDGDGRADAFLQVSPGLRLCWDVRVGRNDFVPPAAEPQVLTARLEVRGGPSETVLDSREVYFLVPPETAQPPPE